LWVVAVPLDYKGAHGLREAEIFRRSCPIPSVEVEKLSRIILMKLMPALAEADIEIFGEALNDIQTVGFKKIEVELAGSLPKKLIKLMLEQGAYGAGLSSFGPAVYGLIKGKKQAENLKRALSEHLEAEGYKHLTFHSETNRKGAVISQN
jgi:beta-ribofuranosylaminobenzene 5'-phosphate synthase